VTTVRFSMVVYVLAGVALCDRLVVLGRVASTKTIHGRCLARSSPLRTQIESHGEWEPLLITRGYHFVYFDGLNRFYVADEHATLDKSFHAPANAFDDFITASAVDLDQQLNAANAELEKVKAELGEVTAEVQYVKLHLAHTTNKLRVMQRSAAWRALERIRYLTGLSS
jgi:hypothetical protein